MSTVLAQFNLLGKLWALPYTILTRAGAFALAVVDVFDEAQAQAQKMQRRFPNLRW